MLAKLLPETAKAGASNRVLELHCEEKLVEKDAAAMDRFFRKITAVQTECEWKPCWRKKRNMDFLLFSTITTGFTINSAKALQRIS